MNKIVGILVLAALLGTSAIAQASHGEPEDYGVPLFERIAASPEWEDWTGLVRPTLFLISDFVEAAKHGFGLLERRGNATISPAIGSNVDRTSNTTSPAPPEASTGGRAGAGMAR